MDSPLTLDHGECFSRISVVFILQVLWYSHFLPKVSSQMFGNRRVFCENDGISEPEKNHTATVFFLHSLHEFGVSMKLYVEMVEPLFPFKHIKTLYPNAPLSYYGPLMGYERFTWFDELGRGPEWKEVTEDAYEISMEGLTNLILREIQHHNLTEDRVIIGGYDQGGAMAMHISYRYFRDIAGVFALSSYLCNNSLVYKELEEFKAEKLPPLYHVTGAKDEIINPEWAESTFKRLQKLGVPGEFHIQKDLSHELNKEEIDRLRNWITKRLGTD